MLAVVKEALSPGLAVKQVEMPPCRDGWVVVKVTLVGICGSDIPILNGTREVPLPFIAGHEFVGTIAQVGRGVAGWQVGDGVIPSIVQNCLTCDYCRQGKEQLCDTLLETGIHVDGAFAEYVPVPATCLHPWPGGLPADTAVFADPLASAYHPVRMARLTPEEDVVIFGPGPIGLLMVQLARLAGVKSVTLVGTRADRLALGAQLGAHHTLNVRETPDLPGALKGLLGGRLADVAFEVTGQAGMVPVALQCLKKGGRLVAESIYHDESSLPMIDVVRRELTILGSICYTYGEFRHCIHLLETGKVQVNPLVSHHFALDEAADALDVINQKKAIKVLLKP